MKNKLIFILWLLMFSFFSCNFGIKENEETNSKEYFTVKGSCSIQGAIPSDLFPEKSIKQNAQRTVVPKIEIGGITVSFESETGDTKSAEVVNKDFEIELPPGKWTVKAQGKKSDDVIIESESCQIELSAENKSANVELVLKPTQSDTGEGTFKFSFGTNYNKVLGMKYTYKKHGATESQSAKIVDFSDTINKELSSGVYTFRFDFYSDRECEGELLYSFKEVVNIFDGLITDTWIGAGEYIDGGNICITNNMIEKFISTTVYVSKDGDDYNLGTFFEPVKTIQNAVDKVIAMNEVTVSSEENPYKILLLSDIISDDPFESNNNALVNINPSSASGTPLYLTISKCGDGNATINANRSSSDTGRVMYIGKNANVTLQNLILTGGHLKSDNGAGLYILNNDANVKIVNSEISKNEIDNGVGAGLHVGNKSLDGNLNLTIENSKISSNTINHNDAIGTYSGAGIAIENVAVTLTITNSKISENVIDQKEVKARKPRDKGVGLWLGNYATTIISGTEISGTEISGTEISGTEIKNNKIIEPKTTNGNAGGGICIDGGTLTINGTTTISDNFSGYGGGVCIFGGNFTMSNGAEISNCTGDYAGGIIIDTGGTFTMNDGATISTCTSLQYGGGVVVYDSDDGIPGTGGTFTMNGGAISGCTAKNGLGGGVYVEKGTFNMNDGAVISSNNDVYLADGTTITVTEKLTSTDTVATITPNEYSPDRQVLVAGSGVTLSNSLVKQFNVTPAEGDKEWFVDLYGYLGKVPEKEKDDEENDVYLMESYDNLLYIAQGLKTGSITSLNMKLTDDINIPSGKWQFSELNAPDHSTIDGQGHSITIDEDVSKFGNSAGGLFYKCNLSTVKNLVLKGSITANKSAGEYIGALCRSAWRTTIQNVMSTVTVQDNGSGNAGGLVGYFGGNNKADDGKFTPDTFIKNCAVYANISSKNGTAGGLVGESWANEQTWRIENCIYKGTVSSTHGYAGALIGNENTGKTSYLTNIWYCEPNDREIFGKIGNGGEEIKVSEVNRKNEAEIASDGAADLLNTDSDETDNYVWEYDSSLGYPTLKTLSSE